MDKNLEKNLGQLEAVMLAQLGEHEQLLVLFKRKKDALAHADHRQVTACCALENVRVQAIAELEKRRLTLAAELTLMVEPKAAAPMRLPELAARLPEPARGRLMVLRHQVRERMEKARVEAGIITRATESLMGHIQGLVQTIGGAVVGGGSYNRAGTLPRAALAISTFNTTA